MCVRVRVSSVVHGPVVRWDPREVSILVRPGADPRLALVGVAAVLLDVGARRTWAGFRCFCGEPVRLPSELARSTGLRPDGGHPER